MEWNHELWRKITKWLYLVLLLFVGFIPSTIVIYMRSNFPWIVLWIPVIILMVLRLIEFQIYRRKKNEKRVEILE